MATTTIPNGTTSAGLTETPGNGVDVLSGGTITGNTVQAGSVATNAGGMSSTVMSSGTTITAGTLIEIGGTDSGGTILAGAAETVLGNAVGDQVYGVQLVSAATATVSNETVFAGGIVDLYLKGAVATGLTISSGGTLNISGNAVGSNTTLVDAGTIVFQSPKAVLSGSLTLVGSGNTLLITAAQSPGSAGLGDQAVISGFSAGDVIDDRALVSGANIALTSAANGPNTTVNITSGGTVVETFIFAAGTNIAALTLAADAGGFTEIVPCYCPGTNILTTRGEVAVELLSIGDTVVTATGEHRPIKWVGSRTVSCAQYSNPLKVWPVRIVRDAFGPSKPARDLYVSPDHSLAVSLIDDVLIPADKLVNGATIAYAPCDIVTYWHVELDSHDLLLAENLAAESYLEMNQNRSFFDTDAGSEGPSAEILARSHADFCRPFVAEGTLLAAARAQLAARAEKLGWERECAVTLTATAGSVRVPVTLSGGEATIALARGTHGLTLAIDTFVPAHLGEADPRRVGLAVYSVSVTGADGVGRIIDLDGPMIQATFHPGERVEGLHYRWTEDALTLPAETLSEFPGPLTVRVCFEPTTVRGWRAPAVEAVAAPVARLRAA